MTQQTCRGGRLTPDDLNLLRNNPKFCKAALKAWPELVDKVDMATEFGRSQEESEDGALNYAITAVENNLHKTTLTKDAGLSGVDNERAIKVFTRLCFRSAVHCIAETVEVVGRCGNASN